MKLKYLFALIVYFFSCKEEIPPAEEAHVYWGTINVEKNGTTWVASPSVSIHSKLRDRLNLSFTSFDMYGFKNEKCSIFKVPSYPGTYVLQNTSIQENDSLIGSNYFFVDYDLILGYYNVLEADSSNFVTVLSYDTLSKEVKGTFDITFIVAQRPYAGAPDTIRLHNGVFHTKVLK